MQARGAVGERLGLVVVLITVVAAILMLGYWSGVLAFPDRAPEPGEARAVACGAAADLEASVRLMRDAVTALEAGDRLAAIRAERDARALLEGVEPSLSYAAFLDARTVPPTPGFDALLAELYGAIPPAEMLITTLTPPVAPIVEEGRPGLLAAAEAAVAGMELPHGCLLVSTAP
ncbi:MAG TPA: hypothetical protein VFY23_12415 [Candidatus Limnocylindrales bacterium]|nr:hypothetical protein [Candidatus Limnocylindrales bacterium]